MSKQLTKLVTAINPNSNVIMLSTNDSTLPRKYKNKASRIIPGMKQLTTGQFKIVMYATKIKALVYSIN